MSKANTEFKLMEEEQLSVELIEAQYALKNTKGEKNAKSLLILVSGIELAGKGEAVKQLREWVDPRYLRVKADAPHPFNPKQVFWQPEHPSEPLRLLDEPVEPLKIAADHPLWSALDRAREAVERAAEADHKLDMQLVQMIFHKQLLLRRAEADEKYIGLCGIDLLDDRCFILEIAVVHAADVQLRVLFCHFLR